ncbi:MAG: LysR family transcriptional regulator [Pseudomonadales bacterium]
MDLNKVDLNLLIYLDALLREQNVTRAAQQIGISQPAMSNGLRRLRSLFDDPILIRTSEGMTPTERAIELQPKIRDVLASIEQFVQPQNDFEPGTGTRMYRVMASDYVECTLLTRLTDYLREHAPGITLDILTPSDVGFRDVEQGKVDMVINRFEDMPLSFHQSTVWKDSFSCVLGREHLAASELNWESYMAAEHVWCSKTGMGIGMGVNPEKTQKLGWVDDAVDRAGGKRNIRVFTRHYQAAMLLCEQQHLIATVPTRYANLYRDNKKLLVLPAPFDIPTFELKIAWSPLLQHNPAHRWMRHLIQDIAAGIPA